MADLEFKHQVHEIPKGEELKTSPGRKVAPITTNVPDFQHAVNQYAADTNWMTAVGSTIAQKASSAIAVKLGAEMGKNPQGELPVSFTEFDKQLAQSYETQAKSTLGLQALKLISSSNLELANKPRITSDMIATTQKNTLQGLEKIFSMAPSSIRPDLESHYGGVMINQNEHLVNRMIGEQKADRIDQFELNNKITNENIYSLQLNGIQLDKEGNSKSALSAMNATIQAAKSAHARGDISLVDAKAREDTARQLFLSGREIRKALKADQDQKLPEHLKSLADNPPKDISASDHTAVMNSVLQYMQQQATLKLQSQQLTVAKAEEAIIKDPLEASKMFGIISADLSPLQAENLKIKMMQAIKKQNANSYASNLLSANWNNPTAGANASSEIINKTFNDKVAHAIENSHKTTIPLRSPIPLTRDDAEVLVASSAGFQIPVFTKSLQNKLMSSNPMNVESGIQQIHKLIQNGNGQALKGLTDQDWSMFSAAQSLRDSPDPIKANQDAHNRIYNQDPKVQELNDKIFASKLTKANTAGKSNDVFALNEFGMSKSDFLNPTLGTAYGLDILQKFNNFFSISGNFEEAKASTQRWVDENYGNTFINGGKHTTLHPIEQVVGFQDRDGVPYIQSNIIDQLNDKLTPLRVAFDKGDVNEYWETIPVEIPKKKGNILSTHPFNELPNDTGNIKSVHPFGENLDDSGNAMALHPFKKDKEYVQPSSKPSAEHGIYFKTYDPIKIKRHMRTEKGIKEDTFNVILVGNSFGDYDVSIETKDGMRSLYREAPALGIMSVSPQRDKIWEHYKKDH